MSKLSFAIQFARLIKNPVCDRHLTKDLYQELHCTGGLIAHYNREGFYKTHFGSLVQFDRLISEVRRCKPELLKDIPLLDIANARYSVAAIEASQLYASIRVREKHLKDLEGQFTRPLIDMPDESMAWLRKPGKVKS